MTMMIFNSDPAKRAAAYATACPPEYRATTPARLPAAMLEQVMAWRYGPTGLCIMGPSGTGKTRAAWLLVRRLHVEEGHWVEALGPLAFAHECARRFMAGDRTGPDDTAEEMVAGLSGEAWVERLAKATVLFFDDLGKFKNTERVESELFGLIEERCAWHRPTIITTNTNGAGLAGRMTADRATPLVRRLREYCQTVVAAEPCR